MMAATLPTRPSDNRTLIPWGWDTEPVRISCTVPRVSFPLRWSLFWMISTVIPCRMFARCREELSGVMITHCRENGYVFPRLFRGTDHDERPERATGC